LAAGCAKEAPAPPAAPAPTAPTPAIVFLGDSLTAGYGLAPEEAYPALIAQKLVVERLPYRVINAGVNGDTTAGGLRRVSWLLQEPVKVLVVALGANDGLRGVPVGETRKNLEAILKLAKARSALIVLAGMKIPVNYGEEYRAAFERMYAELGQQYAHAFIPFLLEGVGGRPEFNQPDGLHPTREGQQKIAETVWKALRPLL